MFDWLCDYSQGVPEITWVSEAGGTKEEGVPKRPLPCDFGSC